MKIIAPFAVALALGGCATLNTTGLSPQAASFVDNVGQLTTVACAFVPTATTIAELVKTGDPKLQTAEAIAAAVCAAVGPATTAHALIIQAAPTIDGVPVIGRRV